MDLETSRMGQTEIGKVMQRRSLYCCRAVLGGVANRPWALAIASMELHVARRMRPWAPAIGYEPYVFIRLIFSLVGYYLH